MSQSSSKIDYLKKYLSGSSKNDKKKKRRKANGSGMRIVDDDVDLSKLRHLDNDELEILGGGEDAPVVVGIVDERPDHVKIAEQFSKDKWKVVTKDDGFNSSITVQSTNSNRVKTYVSSDSDLSPARNKKQNVKSHKSHTSKQSGSGSDLSPVRQKKVNHLRKRESNSDLSPQRRKSHGSDLDLSPPRTRKLDTNKRNNSDLDLSPPRGKKLEHPKRQNSHSNLSPTRNMGKYYNERNSHKSSDSDLSPRRMKKNGSSYKKKQFESNSDLSPPRRKLSDDKNIADKKKRERKSRWDTEDKTEDNFPDFLNRDERRSESGKSIHSQYDEAKYKHDRGGDKLQSRDDRRSESGKSIHSQYDEAKYKHDRGGDKLQSRDDRRSESGKSIHSQYDEAKYKHDRGDRKYRDNETSAEARKMERTLDGKKAGLQDATHLREETRQLKRKEEELFGKLSEDLTGQNAKAIKRNLGKRETSEDIEKKRQKEEEQKELEAKYDRWGKGVKQIEDQETRVKEHAHEAAKPLARYRDDRDLEDHLRNMERDGDPMLEYMRRKEKEKGETSGQPARPIYNGPFPPNRFNIRPGHRWDGVDRSNGHEKNYFLAKSKRVALEAEKYKWSTEDM